MKRVVVLFLMLMSLSIKAQVKLCLDSMLKVSYTKKYGFSEGLMCLPFYCDPFCTTAYKKTDTVGLCGKFVFVDKNFVVKIKTGFDIPCGVEPKFSEGLCAVSINNYLCFIDTLGQIKISTDLLACSNQKNRIYPFKNGKAKVYKGSGGLRNFYDVYYINKKGERIHEPYLVKVRIKPPPVVIATRGQKKNSSDTEIYVYHPIDNNQFFEPSQLIEKGKFHLSELDYKMLLANKSHNDNRLFVYYECGDYQLERMAEEDSIYCGKFVFTDTFLNVRIAGNFSLPCGFEPEFSEGLCAVAKDNYIVYIDTLGNTVINTGLKACDTAINKASTFKNGIATLYLGDKITKGLYTTLAINTKGERVRLLEFDDLDLAEKLYTKFKNVTIEECANCFIGRGKTNGLWFLVEKSGKVRKKLELK